MMTTILRVGMSQAVLVALMASALQAQEPPTAGRVLILENERTLEGDIQRQGNLYCLKRSIGETWIPADKVLGLYATHLEAYRVLRARANLDDPDERLRLARWCQRHNLPEQALEEATHAVRLRPSHAESRRLLEHLQRPALAEPEPPAVAEDIADDAGPAVALELSTEALSLFATKVQPILANACASCHASGRGGAFKLTRVIGTGIANQRTVQQNLAAVLAQLNLERPQQSPLLSKAVNTHGDASQPPLKGRQVAAFHTLESWVRLTIAKNPHLREQTGRVVATTETRPETSRPGARPTGWAADAKPKPADKAADPFDPAAFNRQMHSPPKP